MKTRIFVCGMIAAALCVAGASSAQAQYMWYWNGTGSAAWSGMANWTPGTFSGTYWYRGSVINNGGTATIAAGDSVTDGSGNATIFVGGSSGSLGGNGGNGYVNMSGGVLDSSSSPLQEVLGVAAGSGIFTQSGGVNNSMFHVDNIPGDFSSLQLGCTPGGYGEYDLQGGGLNACAIFVGGNNGLAPQTGSGVVDAGTGVFTQTGGSVGSFGIGGSNNAVGLTVGGNWTNGNSYSRTPLSCSALGTYTLGNADGTGAPLLVGGVEGIGVSGTGTFTQNCGTNAIVGGGSGTGAVGEPGVSYNSSVGALLLGWYSGKQGPGTSRYCGNGVGTYNLNGGLLTGDASGNNGLEVVGCAGTGIFSQTGGTNNASVFLAVGGCETYWAGPFRTPYNPAYGTYILSQGLLTTPELYVGAAGTGIFTQTGGTNLVTNGIQLGGEARQFTTSGQSYVSTPGTYNLNGGLLQTNYIGANYSAISPVGPATFNFTAGTLQAPAGGFTNYMPITVGTSASNLATFDPHGQTIIVNGSLSKCRHAYRPGPVGRERQRRRRHGRPRQHGLLRQHEHLHRRHEGSLRHAPGALHPGPARRGRCERRQPGGEGHLGARCR